MDYQVEAPAIIRDFLTYHETIQGHSKRTVDEYFLDLRTFFRYMKLDKVCPADNRIGRHFDLRRGFGSDSVHQRFGCLFLYELPEPNPKFGCTGPGSENRYHSLFL